MAVFVFAGSIRGQCRVREPGPGRSVLQAELAVRDGKLVAVRDPDNESTPAAKTPQFKPSKEFSTATLDDAAKAAITTKLLDWLDPVLARMDPLYLYFLTDEQKTLDKKGQLTAQTAAVRSLTANSRHTVSAFQAWIATLANPGLDFATKLEQQLQHLPGLGLDSQTPMFHTEFSADSGPAVGCFSVEDQVNPATLAAGPNPLDVQFLPLPQPRRTLLNKDEVLRWVGVEVARSSDFWLQKNIQTHFQNLYADIGLQPAVIVSPAAKRRFVHILESAKVKTIMFPVAFSTQLQATAEGTDARAAVLGKLNLAIEKIVYCLLPTEEFRKFQISQVVWPPPPDAGAVPSIGPTLSMSTVSGAASDSDLPLLDLLTLGDKQADLQHLGYALSVTQDSDSSETSTEVNPFVDYVIAVAAQSAAAASQSTPAPVPSTTKPAGPEKPAARQMRALQSPNRNDLGPMPIFQAAVGAQYRPGQGVRALGAAQISRLHLLSPEGNIALQGGSDTTHPVATLNINNDFLFFDALGRRRLSFTAMGGSDVISKRVLAGQEVDQRSNSVSAHTEFDLFRELHGYLLRWTFDAEHQSVALQRSKSNQGLGVTHLTTVDGGALIGYASEASFLPRRFQIEPHFKYGLGLAAGEPVWHRVQVTGSWHQRLSDSLILSLEVGGSVAATSHGTPLFELLSLGGSESVRGFRQDAALGRRLWSVQPEFWAPVPGTVTPKDDDKIRQFLRKNIRLAAFVDVGGIYDTTLPSLGGMVYPAAPPGTRSGPGAGLRILQGPVALKLDWAYGLGGGANGGGHGRFYLGVSRNGF